MTQTFESWADSRGLDELDGDYAWAEQAWKAVQAVQPAQVPAWQPIETAPKDGAPLLLWVDTDDGGEAMTMYRNGDGNWLYEGEPTFCQSFYIQPTHWMPLPTAPEVKP